ncbi:cleavage and polyadenylation specificity factor subunit 6-like [Delphinus delphis]|uniref:cleavage and polyadenylation specificity factor subunit 6-like n=1 Tax=Delphinus delphis TaxID=9728 RepID=UPI0028C37E8F|nr:basic proline-rich protein-like [Delphinus delphis]
MKKKVWLEERIGAGAARDSSPPRAQGAGDRPRQPPSGSAGDPGGGGNARRAAPLPAAPLYQLYWAPCALFGPSRLRAKSSCRRLSAGRPARLPGCARLRPRAPLRLRHAAPRASAAASAGARPPRRHPDPRLPAPGSPHPALGPCGSVPGPSRPAPSPSPKPLLCSPPGPRSLAVCFTPPHPHIPPSLFCLLARSLALRRGEAASQGNPRNLCKKLTMKFKKFFDFGAIFEWIERRKPGSSQRPPSGRTTPAPAGSLQRDAAKEHYINTLGPDLDTEDSCFKKIQSSLKSCNLYAF